MMEILSILLLHGIEQLGIYDICHTIHTECYSVKSLQSLAMHYNVFIGITPWQTVKIQR